MTRRDFRNLKNQTAESLRSFAIKEQIEAEGFECCAEFANSHSSMHAALCRMSASRACKASVIVKRATNIEQVGEIEQSMIAWGERYHQAALMLDTNHSDHVN